ncbi:PEP-CTERM sorting domain-containing protein [Oscillatoriales cyanobacterium LEGE 11467]|uniref:PEP-CTERM sorting domain-containing protein n=1 Tax=Zarconia navalis LEGE 11467 TaxID=1828826 RepID=A0A928VZX4_9CYAN|nr:PEP-CTERM sorting domain-containing protein [Zarconia navalis]MBE9041308.1 PEP-CTERM sorting domain-containing protein [Zarconia navalis LEGE 11467]
MNTNTYMNQREDPGKTKQLTSTLRKQHAQTDYLQTLHHRYRNRLTKLVKTAPKLAIALTALLSEPAPVQAASFDFTYAPGTTLEQMLGFEVAANVWSNFLVDDANVNLFVEVVDWYKLPPFVVGGSWQSGLWQEFRWQTLPTEAMQANTQSVPEPTSTTGLLGVGLLSFGLRLKHQRRQL